MQNRRENLDYCHSQVRSLDLDRYYLSLFAPASSRSALWALYAFNLEVVKTRNTVSESMLAEIRLQWWREALDSILDGNPRKHPVVEALYTETADYFSAIRPLLLEVVDTWSDDFGGGKADLSAIQKHAIGTGGALTEATMIIVKQGQFSRDDQTLARYIGEIWALLGVIRALPHELNNPDSPFADLGSEDGNRQLSHVLEELVLVIQGLINKAEHLAASFKLHQKPKFILSMLVLARLEIQAAALAGDNIIAIENRMPGNLRKLLALTRFHIFG